MSLTITRKPGQSLSIGPDIVVTVKLIPNLNEVRLSVDAPKNISIDRTEVLRFASGNRNSKD